MLKRALQLSALTILFTLALTVPAFAQNQSGLVVEPPTSQTIFDAAGKPSVVVDWKSTADKLSYTVERSSEGEERNLIMVVDPPTEPDKVTEGALMVDPDVQAGKEYNYYVTAYDLFGHKSATQAGTVKVAFTPPQPPTPAPQPRPGGISSQTFDDIINKLTYISPAITGITQIQAIVIEGFLAAAGFLAIVGFIIVGIKYLTAGGDETKMQAAKKNLLWIVFGIVTILLLSAIAAIIRTSIT